MQEYTVKIRIKSKLSDSAMQGQIKFNVNKYKVMEMNERTATKNTNVLYIIGIPFHRIFYLHFWSFFLKKELAKVHRIKMVKESN